MVRRTLLAILLLLPAACSLAGATPHVALAQPEVSEALIRSGIRPVMPPTEAAAFTLPDLGGAEVSLSDFQGQWVLLTFWATWCGPCISEMPSLQRFWTTHRDSGFAVVAVAVGSDERGVGELVRQQGLTFPVLLDRGDRVASTYQAWSVPLTYLVDPTGNLVGVVRGARDWAEAGALVRELAGLEAGDDTYAAQSPEPVQLPPDLVPPTAAVALADAPVVAGQPFELFVRVSWADTGEDYRIHPPHLTLPDGLQQDTVSASSSSQDGTKVITYTVSLQADEPGTYAVDPVEIRFTPSDGSQPLATRVTGPTAQVLAAPSPLPPWWLLVAVALAAIVGAVLWWRARKTS